MADFLVGVACGVVAFTLLICVIALLVDSKCESKFIGEYQRTDPGRMSNHTKVVRCQGEKRHAGKHYHDASGIAWSWDIGLEGPAS